VVGVGATGRYAAATPADAASALTEGARGDERVLVGVHRPGRCRTAQRGDVDRVGRAARLAHEAGLAVALARDDRNPVRPAVEDVPGQTLTHRSQVTRSAGSSAALSPWARRTRRCLFVLPTESLDRLRVGAEVGGQLRDDREGSLGGEGLGEMAFPVGHGGHGDGAVTVR
jgi:hypothetical protein